MGMFLESIRARARTLSRRIVFPEGADPRIIGAVATLQREGLVEPVVLGDPDAIRNALHEAGGDGEALRVIDPATDPRRKEFADMFGKLRPDRVSDRERALSTISDPLIFGALLVRSGDVDGSVAGVANTTGDVIRAGLRCVGLGAGIETLSAAFYMVVPPFRGNESEVLTFSDPAVVPEPTAEQLVDIAVAAVDARRLLVEDQPRVAFLSYSTHGSAGGESVRRVRTAFEEFRRRMPDVPADGELQVDAALVEEVARRKSPGSELAGRANVLIFPNLDAGNIAYKLVQRLGRAEAIGPILQGFARPCNDLSRGASSGAVVDVACITALLTRSSEDMDGAGA